ncbi:uncharacterized protein METZ01_LOCUS482752, partial [marine metagenome]
QDLSGVKPAALSATDRTATTSSPASAASQTLTATTSVGRAETPTRCSPARPQWLPQQSPEASPTCETSS